VERVSGTEGGMEARRERAVGVGRGAVYVVAKGGLRLMAS